MAPISALKQEVLCLNQRTTAEAMNIRSIHNTPESITLQDNYRMRPVGMVAKQDPPLVSMDNCPQRPTPSDPVLIALATLAHALAAEAPALLGADIIPLKVIRSPGFAPSGGLSGSTLIIEQHEHGKQSPTSAVSTSCHGGSLLWVIEIIRVFLLTRSLPSLLTSRRLRSKRSASQYAR